MVVGSNHPLNPEVTVSLALAPELGPMFLTASWATPPGNLTDTFTCRALTCRAELSGSSSPRHPTHSPTAARGISIQLYARSSAPILTACPPSNRAPGTLAGKRCASPPSRTPASRAPSSLPGPLPELLGARPSSLCPGLPDSQQAHAPGTPFSSSSSPLGEVLHLSSEDTRSLTTWPLPSFQSCLAPACPRSLGHNLQLHRFRFWQTRRSAHTAHWPENPLLVFRRLTGTDTACSAQPPPRVPGEPTLPCSVSTESPLPMRPWPRYTHFLVRFSALLLCPLGLAHNRCSTNAC